MLRETLISVEKQMLERLVEIRAKFRHSGDKGTSVEDAFRVFLREYLSRILGVGHGEIIDTHGGKSGQTDVVIVNEYHPSTFTENNPGVFFIEGVSAAAEVKTVLNSAHLKSSIDAATNFKNLRAKHGAGTTIYANESDRERFSHCPPYFLVAFQSELTLQTIVEKIESECSEVESKPYDSLDAVFVINEGYAINYGDGKGEFKSQAPSGESHVGWSWMKSDLVLFYCLAWLTSVMPRMRRYEPILLRYMLPDKPPYGKK